MTNESTKKYPKIKEEPIVKTKMHGNMEIKKRAKMVERTGDVIVILDGQQCSTHIFLKAFNF